MSKKAQPYEGVIGCCDDCGAENVMIYRSESGWTCVPCVLEEDQDEVYASLYLEVAQGVLAAETERARQAEAEVAVLKGMCESLVEWYDDLVKEHESAANERTEWVGMSEFEALLQDEDEDLALNDPVLTAIIDIARAQIAKARGH